MPGYGNHFTAPGPLCPRAGRALCAYNNAMSNFQSFGCVSFFRPCGKRDVARESSAALVWRGLQTFPTGGNREKTRPGTPKGRLRRPQVHRRSFGSCFLGWCSGEGFTPQEIATSQPRQTLAGAVASLVCSAAQSWGAGGGCSTIAALAPILP